MKAARRRASPWTVVGVALVGAWLAALVVLPLVALVVHAIAGEAGVVASLVDARHALWLTTWSSLVVMAFDAVAGTALAFVLVRGPRGVARALDVAVDLPFALPTLLPGILLVALLGPQTVLGALLVDAGAPVVFAPPSIVIVLLFVTLPFVVRAVEPVLRAIDVAEEEAAAALGATSTTTLVRVVLPALAPAIAGGALQAFARALAEFGSVVVVSGNIPGKTLTAPALIFAEVEGGRTDRAAVVALATLVLALAAQLAAHRLAGGRRG